MAQGPTPQLAWIGLGNMGRGMCKNLVEKGNLSQPLILYNRTTQRAEELSSKLGSGKTKVAGTIAEAVKPAEIIFVCLGDDPAVQGAIEEAVKTPGGIRGKLFCDCSTIHPDTTNEIAKRLTGEGARFVACPVFGAPAMADSGQLLCVLAGPLAATDQIKPFCTGVMGRAIVDYSGQAQGKATLLKVIGNTFVVQMVEALSEGHVVAEKTGLGTDNLHKFIELMFPGPYTAYSTRMRTGDYYNREYPLFAVDLARKDARHATDLAASVGARMRAVEVADSHLAAVKEHMGARGDISGIYGAVRQECGLKFENQ